ncbi:unnamed protein product [Rotaria sp. Silwood2]|nr:unnamed protein product [Rotaria sp. Silwood2]CAF2740833.1 unnamed protein product [Rotaria sp. Silwood2]CAF2765008.1 unnamed protein product [Rotaria sp. Silwood2]CAF3186129.1 unnamed protein product [Rotaria sp. Silwood2]CAF3929429.1 unnamed protein product [Rotaria sp. Silwood2]
MLDIEWPFPTHVDFHGQKMAERLFQVIIVLFGIIGFFAGYMMQQFSMTIYSVLFGLTLPPWPMYRNNPIEWQKPIDSNKETITNKNVSSAKSPKKDARKQKGKKDE